MSVCASVFKIVLLYHADDEIRAGEILSDFFTFRDVVDHFTLNLAAKTIKKYGR